MYLMKTSQKLQHKGLFIFTVAEQKKRLYFKYTVASDFMCTSRQLMYIK